MVKRPVISIVSQQLFNYENGVNTYVQHFAELAGCRWVRHKDMGQRGQGERGCLRS
jgi:hypothetical protein